MGCTISKFTWGVVVTLLGVFVNVFAGESAPDISGVWSRAPADASQATVDPPLKPKYLKAYTSERQAQAPVASGPAGELEKCWVEGMPTIMAARAPLEILQTPGQLTVLAEYMSQTRRIAMDEKPPAPADINPGYMGISVGKWNGETLEVETLGIREDIRYLGIPHSAKMKILERIHLTGAAELQDDLTILDPATVTKPYHLTFRYRKESQHRVMEYACKHPGAAAAANQDDVMKTVRQWVEGLNKGDTKSAIAACAPQTSIVDEFPPHEWHGDGACAKWVSELDVYNRGLGLTDGVVTLGKPRRLDITGDRAYVVVPAEFNFKEHGKPGKEAGALFTVAVQNGAAGWRITGWAWSRP